MKDKKSSKQRLKDLKKADQRIKRERGGKSSKKTGRVLRGNYRRNYCMSVNRIRVIGCLLSEQILSGDSD